MSCKTLVRLPSIWAQLRFSGPSQWKSVEGSVCPRFFYWGLLVGSLLWACLLAPFFGWGMWPPLPPVLPSDLKLLCLISPATLVTVVAWYTLILFQTVETMTESGIGSMHCCTMPMWIPWSIQWFMSESLKGSADSGSSLGFVPNYTAIEPISLIHIWWPVVFLLI